MKRLFRFTHYRRVAVWLFGAVWLAGGSLVATEDALSDPVASSQAHPAFQTLSTIHPIVLPGGSIRDVCPAPSSIGVMVAPAVLTMRVRGLDAVDLCDVLASRQHGILVANPARQEPLVEAGSDSGSDVSTRRTSRIFGSRTSRGGPAGQAGLGDPGLPFTRPLLAGTFRPSGHPFPRETTTGTPFQGRGYAGAAWFQQRAGRGMQQTHPRPAAPQATVLRVPPHRPAKRPPLNNVKETT